MSDPLDRPPRDKKRKGKQLAGQDRVIKAGSDELRLPRRTGPASDIKLLNKMSATEREWTKGNHSNDDPHMHLEDPNGESINLRKRQGRKGRKTTSADEMKLAELNQKRAARGLRPVVVGPNGLDGMEILSLGAAQREDRDYLKSLRSNGQPHNQKGGNTLSANARELAELNQERARRGLHPVVVDPIESDAVHNSNMNRREYGGEMPGSGSFDLNNMIRAYQERVAMESRAQHADAQDPRFVEGGRAFRREGAQNGNSDSEFLETSRQPRAPLDDYQFQERYSGPPPERGGRSMRRNPVVNDLRGIPINPSEMEIEQAAARPHPRDFSQPQEDQGGLQGTYQHAGGFGSNMPPQTVNGGPGGYGGQFGPNIGGQPFQGPYGGYGNQPFQPFQGPYGSYRGHPGFEMSDRRSWADQRGGDNAERRGEGDPGVKENQGRATTTGVTGKAEADMKKLEDKRILRKAAREYRDKQRELATEEEARRVVAFGKFQLGKGSDATEAGQASSPSSADVPSGDNRLAVPSPADEQSTRQRPEPLANVGISAPNLGSTPALADSAATRVVQPSTRNHPPPSPLQIDGTSSQVAELSQLKGNKAYQERDSGDAHIAQAAQTPPVSVPIERAAPKPRVGSRLTHEQQGNTRETHSMETRSPSEMLPNIAPPVDFRSPKSSISGRKAYQAPAQFKMPAHAPASSSASGNAIDIDSPRLPTGNIETREEVARSHQPYFAPTSTYPQVVISEVSNASPVYLETYPGATQVSNETSEQMRINQNRRAVIDEKEEQERDRQNIVDPPMYGSRSNQETLRAQPKYPPTAGIPVATKFGDVTAPECDQGNDPEFARQLRIREEQLSVATPVQYEAPRPPASSSVCPML